MSLYCTTNQAKRRSFEPAPSTTPSYHQPTLQVGGATASMAPPLEFPVLMLAVLLLLLIPLQLGTAISPSQVLVLANTPAMYNPCSRSFGPAHPPSCSYCSC